jgi:hypothetical protein
VTGHRVKREDASIRHEAISPVRCGLLGGVPRRERAVAIAVLVLLGFGAAAVAAYYAFTRNRLLSHALGYHRDRAVIFGAVAVVLWVAAAIVARLRPRPA